MAKNAFRRSVMRTPFGQSPSSGSDSPGDESVDRSVCSRRRKRQGGAGRFRFITALCDGRYADITAVRDGTGLPILSSSAPVPPRCAPRRSSYRIGTGWIDTNLPSQIIRFGAYRHDVKNRDSWPGVILVFGRMS